MLLLFCFPPYRLPSQKKFINGFEIKFDLKGADLMKMELITVIGVLGLVPTDCAGRCKTKGLKVFKKGKVR